LVEKRGAKEREKGRSGDGFWDLEGWVWTDKDKAS
jgi:hypothetical protein